MLFPPYLLKSLLALSFTFLSLGLSASDDLSAYEMMLKKGEYKELVKSLDVLNRDSFTPDHFQLYVSGLLNIDLDDAEDAAKLAIAKYNDNADMYLLHASVMGEQAQDSVFSALGYAEKALISLEKASGLKPENPKYLQALMSFHLMAPSIAGGDTDTALTLAQKISSLDELKGIFALTNYYRSIEEEQKAFTSIEQGILKFPNEIGLYTQLADLYVRVENFDKAIDVYLSATLLNINKPADSQLLDKDLNDKYERNLLMLYNSHYQIGRIALASETRSLEGIKNLITYITLYQSSTIDLLGLPSTDWAYLRKAGLMLANNQVDDAQEALEKINNIEKGPMEKTYKKLNKKVKRALKRKS